MRGKAGSQPPLPDGPLVRAIVRSGAFRRVRGGLSALRPWGAAGVDAYTVLRFFAVGLFNGSVDTRAAAISFRLFLAFFPAMILVVSLVPFTPLETPDILEGLAMVLPEEAVGLLELTVDDFMAQRQGTLLSVGFVLLLFYASGSVNAILKGFGESVHVRDRPHPMVFRLVSIGLLVLLTLMFLTAVLLLGVAGEVLDWAHSRRWLRGDVVPWLEVARWGLAVAMVHGAVTLLYNVGAIDRGAWQWRSTGATVATVAIVLLTLGFSWFVAHFASYNKLYGSLGTLLVTLIWVNSNSTVLLLGFELNAAIHRAHDGKSEVLPMNENT
ncbi:MAG: YihY/virulence factor BrkB family protein [Flavobacteriales bacterium]